ncbi:LRRNT_2 domain-containing protein, partial [Psidium guajava]
VVVSLILAHTVSSADTDTRVTLRKPKCREDERSALLEFKRAFFRKSLCVSDDELMALKLESWRAAEGEAGDCCAWDGVECDEETGRVVGLDLENSCLHGPIGSNASLFRLVRLQRLNLAANDFKLSRIPSAIGNLQELTSLVLFDSSFRGQIPREVLNLTNLSFLDLSYNALELKTPGIENLVRSLTKMEGLNLSQVLTSGPLPEALADLSNLTSLVLANCTLQGELPTATFELTRLETLDVSLNKNLSVRVPEFHWSSPLKSLSLSWTRCSGQLPGSLGNLSSLIELKIASCGLSGVIPSSVGELAQLYTLDLSENQLRGEIPPSLGKLVGLTYLDLSSNQLSGEIPSALMSLAEVTLFDLSYNRLTGQIPSQISGLTGVLKLDLSYNRLEGPLPRTIFDLKNLNKLTLDTLEWIDLSFNGISGQVPQWLLNVSTENLAHLNLSKNSLTGFPSYPVEFKWANLQTLDLRYNGMEGPLPIPPRDILFYLASNNKLTGEIPPMMCQLSSIQILDLAKNELSGVLPSCLSNLSDTLLTLSLHGNGFNGRIPPLQKEACELKMIDLSDNQLQGPLPRGLGKCVELEFLNLGNNRIVGTFPSGLGSLPNLKVLILHSNRFHGAITEPQRNHHHFPKLHIIDLSMNNFSGGLPSKYFDSWNAMKFEETEEVVYYADRMVQYAWFTSSYGDYDYSFMILNKGIEMEYNKILEYLTVIDLSGNGFVGEIPSSIGSLKELHLLNLSNNAITGSIPSSLADLTKLEALDLSSNELTGKIPPALTQLTSLSFFNASRNRLAGPIPREKQFNTFENSSYGGNLGLCGPPLTKKCGNLEAPPPPPSDDDVLVKEDSRTSWIEELDWKIVLMGFASGSVVGAVVGLNYTTGIQHWFVDKYCRGKQRRPSHRRRVA